MNICVFGASSPTIDDSYIEAVEKMGEFMAERGHGLVFGAGANGLMGAAARGVKRGGGNVVGVIPKFFKNNDIEAIYGGCDELIFTETMRERKAIMEERADSFIVTPGGIGTYEELYEILTLKQLGQLDKTIVILNINGFYNDMLAALEGAIGKSFVTEKCRTLFTCVDDWRLAVLSAEEKCDTVSVSEMKKG